jgi:hypothetical protein
MTGDSHVHSTHASDREKLLEHLFVGDLLRCLWRHGKAGVEVLRSEVDGSGYDLIFEFDGILRHIQLKSSFRGAKTRDVKINAALARKPSGCIVWVFFEQSTMDLGPFLWFGGEPGKPLPPLGDRVGKHTKGDSTGRKASRPNIRLVAKTQFQKMDTMDAVVCALFGAR